MVKVYNARTLAKQKVEDRQVQVLNMFKGDASANLNGHNTESMGKIQVVPGSAVYNGSEGEAKIMADIEQLQKLCKENPNKVLDDKERAKFNAAQYPGQTAIEALIGTMYMDITRRAQEGGDLTSMFATEINDANSDAIVRVNMFYPYVGKMGEVSGSNDGVNLIEQKLGGTDSFSQSIKAVGWKDSLENLLFNKVHNMAKVNQAAANADVDARNAATIGTIVGTSFSGAQAQAADSTSGATWDVLMYNTLRKGIKKLRALKDPQTGRKIAVPQIYLLCNSADTWDIQRVINGQLSGGAGVLNSKNLTSLPISDIIEYDHGITDGYTYGQETLSFPGVTAGTCYLYVPGMMYVMNKRGLTLETGSGSVLQLSTEEKAWYRVNGIYTSEFLGGAGGGTAGEGFIVKVTLPTDA